MGSGGAAPPGIDPERFLRRDRRLLWYTILDGFRAGTHPRRNAMNRERIENAGRASGPLS